MKIVGIDIGIWGAIAVLDCDSNYPQVIRIPRCCRKGNRRCGVAYGELTAILLDEFKFKRNPNCIWLEKTFTQPMMGRPSCWNIGHQQGFFEGFFQGHMLPYQLVRPQVWKKEFGLIGRDKESSIEVASRLFPTVDIVGKNQKFDHNVADALLVAEYGRRH
jgi:hypothetical protein